MTEPDWGLLTQKIHETWERTRKIDQIDARFDRMEQRLDRIEQQMAVVVKLAQAREADQAVNRQLAETWAAVRAELLDLNRRLETLERKVD